MRPVLLVALALAAAAGGLLAPSCTSDHARSALPTRAERFEEGRAWIHLEDLCRLGPAGNGLPGHERVGDYLRRCLRSTGAIVRDVPFTHVRTGELETRQLVNISARYGPPDAKTWILLGTHYDTRLWAEKDEVEARRDQPIQGANDGCSGTAVLLEVARVLGEAPPEIGVEIVFFDGEDFGRPDHIQTDYFLGSRHLFRRLRELHPEGPPACVVVLDMVGDADLSFRRDGSAELSYRAPALSTDPFGALSGRAKT